MSHRNLRHYCYAGEFRESSENMKSAFDIKIISEQTLTLTQATLVLAIHDDNI